MTQDSPEKSDAKEEAGQSTNQQKRRIFGSTGFIKNNILEPIDKRAGEALDFARQPQNKLFDMVNYSWTKEGGVKGKLKAAALFLPAAVCFVAVEGIATTIKEATNCIRKPLAFIYNASATVTNIIKVTGKLLNCIPNGFNEKNRKQLGDATKLLGTTAKDAGMDLFNSAKAIGITALTLSPLAPLVPLASGLVVGAVALAPAMTMAMGAPHAITTIASMAASSVAGPATTLGATVTGTALAANVTFNAVGAKAEQSVSSYFSPPATPKTTTTAATKGR